MRQSRTTIVVFAAALILIISAAAYWLSINQTANENTANQNDSQANPNQPIKVSFEKFSGQGVNYTFDVIKDWTSIAPAEVEKTLTEEQRHGYQIVYFSHNTENAIFSVMVKTAGQSETLKQIVTDEMAAARQADPAIVPVTQTILADRANVRLDLKNSSGDYVTIRQYFLLSKSDQETRWVLFEFNLVTSRLPAYQEVIEHLINSFEKL